MTWRCLRFVELTWNLGFDGECVLRERGLEKNEAKIELKLKLSEASVCDGKVVMVTEGRKKRQQEMNEIG
jgi:hypothetical protein